jgi:TRAP-type mannitol/chloroaromatic compound transport system permease small subunit
MHALLPRLVAVIDRVNDRLGRAVAWLTLAMVVVYFLVALLRYAFGVGWIWMQEAVIWMHALVFMVAAAHTLQKNQHVRVDIFYSKRSARGKLWTDLAGSLIFLLPLALFLFWAGWDYVAASWAMRERSSDAGGLPAVYLLKTLILVLAAQLALQALAQAGRAWLGLRGAPQP